MSGTRIAEALVRRLAQHGVRRFFGVPGGDCSLDLIDAAPRHGLEFVLTRGETAAAIMAGVTAELTGTPGVLMTTRGPGLANAVNGIACAALDRSPLLVLSDGQEPGHGHVSHQRLDQAALLRPLTKGESRLDGADPVAELDALLGAAQAAPAGPVYLELIGQRIREAAPAVAGGSDAPPVARPAVPAPAEAALAAARAVLGRARRPAIVAGLQALDSGAAEALRGLAARWGCPVLFTYKAKGVLAETDPLAVGPFIGGAAEDPLLRAADAVLLFGADPIEFPPQPWRYAVPVVELTTHAVARPYVAAAATVAGDLAAAAAALGDAVAPGGWTAREIAGAREAMRALALAPEDGPFSPGAIVAAIAAAVPSGTRIAVDAGAHMLPVMALWPALAPRGVLISRGLATMGYALPAAIAAALAEPERPVLAFTGDGGLMMAAAELATAAQLGCRIIVVVFNDATMSLIKVKQRRRQLPERGMAYGRSDLATVARGFGCLGLRVESEAELGPALRRALDASGPVLLDVAVDAETYHAVVRRIRG
ncbi:thiamine pyrophosphate-binding protein [Roseomonas sp. NAR14]|uniref:Thiamine pyrophosphate-binding protein n=1 Tax=Roseomonas acroporae TaxID=2937791 RepID=A0A9X1YBZ6_9PROT|nr:thiamine pyrophosphate-dependent enzyme [Roseomonas acroporae]MCK8787659.1 thiamine pyrophosphate-binding protein [Roseomonas acroporae]